MEHDISRPFPSMLGHCRRCGRPADEELASKKCLTREIDPEGPPQDPDWV